jgi:hypothetical protein
MVAVGRMQVMLQGATQENDIDTQAMKASGFRAFQPG